MYTYVRMTESDNSPEVRYKRALTARNAAISHLNAELGEHPTQIMGDSARAVITAREKGLSRAAGRRARSKQQERK